MQEGSKKILAHDKREREWTKNEGRAFSFESGNGDTVGQGVVRLGSNDTSQRRSD